MGPALLVSQELVSARFCSILFLTIFFLCGNDCILGMRALSGLAFKVTGRECTHILHGQPV